MKDCMKFQKLMDQAILGELDKESQKVFDSHLDSCSNCQRKYQVLSGVVRQLRKGAKKDPGKEFWNNYWTKLESKLPTIEKRSRFRINASSIRHVLNILSVPSPLMKGIAATVLLGLGIFIGWLFFAGGGQHSLPQEQLLSAKLSRYLDRSKIIIIALANYDPQSGEVYAVDMEEQKKMSRVLIQQAQELKKDLSQPVFIDQYDLISDIEMILIQFTNLDKNENSMAFDLIKIGLKNRDILFKINVEEILLVQKSDFYNRRQGKKTIKPEA